MGLAKQTSCQITNEQAFKLIRNNFKPRTKCHFSVKKLSKKEQTISREKCIDGDAIRTRNKMIIHIGCTNFHTCTW